VVESLATHYPGGEIVSRDLRAYARRTNVRLAVGAFFLLFVIGIGLIYFVYGKEAALFGFLCFLGALLPIGLILLFLAIIDWIVKRAGRE
jgi:hypothetical protein